MINFERSFSPDNAIHYFDNKEHNLEIDLIRFDGKYPVYKCYLTDNNNSHTYIGGGGGLGSASQAAALFESAQHYFSTRGLQDNLKDIHFFPIVEAPELGYLSKTEFLPGNLCNFPDQELPWLQYKSYTDEQIIYYPVTLTEVRLHHFPKFKDYMDFNWMSHDTGMAIGSDFMEASIHGINEWIERESYGFLLLKLFINKSNKKIRLLDHFTIPEHLFQLVKYIEQNFSDDLLIVDITSDINVPAFLVSFTKQPAIFQPRGMAASLSKSCALERAIYEALQARMLYNEKSKESEFHCIKSLKNTPLLLKAAECNLTDLINNDEYVSINFSQVADYSSLTDLSEQLNKLHNLLSSKGLKAFYHYYALTDHLVCLGVIIPGLDQFFMVRCGRFIMPNSRGLQLL